MSTNETKLCKHCRSEIDAQAKVCPHCRMKQGGNIWVVILVVFLTFGFFGMMLNYYYDQLAASNYIPNQPGDSSNAEKLTIEGETTPTRDSVSIHISGIIKNNSDKEYSYVQVTFNIYDEEGNQIGTALDNINSLKPGSTWKFKAIYLDSDNEAASYDLDSIEGF